MVDEIDPSKTGYIVRVSPTADRLGRCHELVRAVGRYRGRKVEIQHVVREVGSDRMILNERYLVEQVAFCFEVISSVKRFAGKRGILVRP
jgi:hypothetical protein